MMYIIMRRVRFINEKEHLRYGYQEDIVRKISINLNTVSVCSCACVCAQVCERDWCTCIEIFLGECVCTSARKRQIYIIIY